MRKFIIILLVVGLVQAGCDKTEVHSSMPAEPASADPNRLSKLFAAYLDWHGQQLIAEQFIQPFTTYKSDIIDDERSFSFLKVIDKQKELISSAERAHSAGPEFKAAMRKWRSTQIEASNILKNILNEKRIVMPEENDPISILDHQREDGHRIEEETKLLDEIERPIFKEQAERAERQKAETLGNQPQ
ncbi:MAG: hypothetical protein QM755_02330 [Luteolibacter sp.]